MQSSRKDKPQNIQRIDELRGQITRLEAINKNLQEQLALHQQTEEELRQTEDRYRTLFNNANAAIFVENMDDEILDANPYACTMLGYSLEELLTLKVSDLLASDDLVPTRGVIKNELIRTNLISIETLNRRRDGTIFPVEVSLSRAGDSGLVYVIVQDISDRKKTEIALKESEARYRALFEDSPISLWEEDMSEVKNYLDELRAAGVVDFRAYFTEHPNVVADCAKMIRVLDVNQSTLKLFKHPHKEDLTAKVNQGIDIGRDIDDKFISFREELIARAEGKTHFSSEGIQYTLTGEPFDALISVTVAPGYENTWSKVFVSIIDLTESRQAQKTLRENEAQSRLITDNMVDSIFQIDADHNIIYASPSIQRIYGYSPQEIMGRLSTELIHPEDVIGVTTEFQRAVDEKAPSIQLEYRYRHANGDYLWTESATRLFYNDQGQFNGAIFGSRDISGRKLAEQERQRQIERLSALREIDRAVASSLDLKITLDILLDQVVGQLKVDAADVLLYSPGLQMLEYAAGQGFITPQAKTIRLKLGQSFAGYAAMLRQRVLLESMYSGDTSRITPFLSQEGFKFYAGLPLIAKGQLKGVIEVFHRSEFKPEPDWLEYLDILAGQAAIAVENLQMVDSLQQAKQELEMAYDTTIEGWARALDLRDRETEGHSRRVMELTIRMSNAMGVPETDLIHIYRGALLHDIGKMAIADEILLKPTSLTEAEWQKMHQHPTFALNLLSPIPYLQKAIDIPYCHHEKWDGSGYPRKLAGNQIPLAARIFAIVDVWDALTHDRPYRRAWPKEKAIAYINEQSGASFDPDVVKVFLRIVASDEYDITSEQDT